MAGSTLEIHLDDALVRARAQELRDRLADLTPFFRDLGETLLNSTRQRFVSQTAPDGAAWAPLSPGYAARKRRNASLILTLNAHLRGTLNYRAEPDALRIGTPLIYGAAHQFGRPEINLPARPFLGLSAADRQMIAETLAAWLAR